MVNRTVKSLRTFLESNVKSSILEEFKAENELPDGFEFNDELREKLARKITNYIMKGR